VGVQGYEIRIAGNPNLISMTGFPQIGTLPMGLYLEGGGSLSYSAFSGVSVIQGKLELRGFGANGSISGLANLSSVVGDVVVENYNGTTLGLSTLATVGGSLRLRYNHQLADLNGLAGMRSVAVDMVVDDNDGLTSLLGLHGIATVGGNFQVTNNGQISNSQAEGLRDAIGQQNIGGSINISN
jgi:hypothetical protein